MYLKSLARFIPTPVGNTLQRRGPPNPETVHPHACGEHSGEYRIRGPRDGSSPRLWGTHRHVGGKVFEIRFIPTPVGNTKQNRAGVHDASVHPHACGEH